MKVRLQSMWASPSDVLGRIKKHMEDSKAVKENKKRVTELENKKDKLTAEEMYKLGISYERLIYYLERKEIKCGFDSKYLKQQAIKWHLQALINGKEEAVRVLNYYVVDEYSVDVNYELAKCYENGTGIKKNYNEAIRYYSQILNVAKKYMENKSNVISYLSDDVVKSYISNSFVALSKLFASDKIQVADKIRIAATLPDEDRELKALLDNKLLLMLSSPECSQDEKLELSIYFLKSNNIEAFCSLKKLSEEGNVKAKLYLGDIYSDETNFFADYVKAFEVYRECHEKHKEGTYKLLNCYYNGLGTEVNYTKSIELIEEILRCKIKDINVDCLGALAFSYKKTLLLLAECYVYGRGIDKNIDKALKICKNFPSEFSAEMLICICLYEKGLYDEAINHCGLLKRQYRIDDGKVDIILLRSYLKTAERSFYEKTKTNEAIKKYEEYIMHGYIPSEDEKKMYDKCKKVAFESVNGVDGYTTEECSNGFVRDYDITNTDSSCTGGYDDIIIDIASGVYDPDSDNYIDPADV